MNGTHHLIINKFCIFRPQYVLLSMDSYRRQDEPVDLDDFQAFINISKRLQGPHYALYNCMEPAGSSRMHKHLQVFEVPQDFSLFPDRAREDTAKAPYRYFLEYFSSKSPTALEVLSAYKRLLSDSRRTVRLGTGCQDGVCPHNLILTESWMLVIPRRRSNVDGASANGAGMMGMVWVSDKAQVERWMALGPSWVLSQLGVEND